MKRPRKVGGEADPFPGRLRFLRSRWVAPVLLVLLILLFLRFVQRSGTLLQDVRNVSLRDVLVQVGIGLLFGANNGLAGILVLRRFGVRMPPWEWFALGYGNSLANQIFPARTGTSFKMIYLKRVHRFAYGDSLSVVFFTMFLSFAIVATVAEVLILRYLRPATVPYLAANSFLLAGLAAAMVVPPVRRIPGLAGRLVARVTEGFRFIRRSPATLAALSFCLLANTAMLFLAIYLGFRAYGYRLDLPAVSAVAIIHNYSAYLVITPGNLGIAEGAISLASELAGHTAERGFAVACLVRIGNLLAVLLAGIPSALCLYRRTRRVP